MCVTAVYNKRVVTLAPHIVFTKHDELFLRAVTVEQGGRRPKELKLGTFKLVGLSSVNPTTRLFVPQFGFGANDPEYAGKTVCVVS
jgi:hypothetical protein